MTVDEYKILIKNKDVLNHLVINATVKELERLDEKILIKKLQRILYNNKIEKPLLHQKADDQTTDYYKIDLVDDDIDYIVTILSDREVGTLGLNYETTDSASRYAKLLDYWNNILTD